VIFLSSLNNGQVFECLPFEGATGIREAPMLSAGPPASYLIKNRTHAATEGPRRSLQINV